MPMTLTYGFTAFKEIEEYLKEESVPDDFSYEVLDMMSCDGSIKLDIGRKDVIKAVRMVTSIEHDYPRWIGVDEKNKKVAIGLWFTRGTLTFGKTYRIGSNGLEETK